MPNAFSYKNKDAIQPSLKAERGGIVDNGNIIPELELF